MTTPVFHLGSVGATPADGVDDAEIAALYDELDDPQPPAKRVYLPGLDVKDARAEALAQGLDRLDTHESALTALLERFYADLAKEVVAALRRGEAKTIFDAGVAAQPARWRQRIEGDATRLVYRIVGDAAGATATRLGVSEPLGLDSPEVQATVRDVVRRMMMSTEARAEAVRRVIFDPGATHADVEDLVRQLIGTFEQRQIWAAEEGRTAVTAAVNGGAHDAAVKAGATTKEWLSSRDDRVRYTHTKLGGGDGQKVGIDDRFRIGDALLRYPGDPEGTPGETINCRCVLLYDL